MENRQTVFFLSSQAACESRGLREPHATLSTEFEKKNWLFCSLKFGYDVLAYVRRPTHRYIPYT